MDAQAEKEKRGFWGGILRRTSLAGKAPAKKARKLRRGDTQAGADLGTQTAREPRRARDANNDASQRRERRRPAQGEEAPRDRRRRRQRPPDGEREARDADWETEPEQPRTRKGKGRRPPEANGHRTPSPAPLTQWPPGGVGMHEQLSRRQAAAWVCRGAPIHTGHKRPIPHMPERYFALYAATAGNREGGGDHVDLHDFMIQLTTMRMQSKGRAAHPWETLEQPSRSFQHGLLPGTVTLNHWASVAGSLPPPISLRDSGIAPRPMDLQRILGRLQELRAGLEDDDPDLLYRILYRRILRDPERIMNPHKTLDKQITDLLLVLSRPEWIDFANPRNQVVTRFIFDDGGVGGAEYDGEYDGGAAGGHGHGHGHDAAAADPAARRQRQHQQREEQYRRFFHQLLLSLELELRIQSRQHGEWAKEKLLLQIPPSIQWNLALARRWRENVRVESFGKTSKQVKLRYKLKRRQVTMLMRFARIMKWPNLDETLRSLEERNAESGLDKISSDAFAFFSALVLPGDTFPFLLMNTLIDLDPDPATDDLSLLSHMHPHCGFQYRGSYTYWSASCIVGKVLAPTCRSLAGWVGPARPTADLGRSQIARIRTRRPIQTLWAEDVASMAERSEPLGPAADAYPVSDYALPSPGGGGADAADPTVRIEMLGLRAAAAAVGEGERMNSPRTFDATVQFAVDGVSWPLRLMYDVSFVCAWPCSDGPHPLFFDYAYTRIRADEVMEVRDWGGLHYGRERKKKKKNGDNDDGGDDDEELDEERVLAVEAFGVSDNEVLARAWCAHWGLGAVVADVRRTCMACAIREAYAAALTVVILVEGRDEYDDDE